MEGSRFKRGCWGVVAGLLTFIAVMIIWAFLMSKIGWKIDSKTLRYALSIFMLATMLIPAVVIGIAIYKQKTWAMRLSGIVLLVLGIGVAGFFLFDFIRAITTGISLTGYKISGSYFRSMVFMIVLVGGGLIVAGTTMLQKKYLK